MMTRRSNRRFRFPVVAAVLITFIGLVGVVPVDAQPAGAEAGETDTDKADEARVNALRNEAVEQIRAVLEAQPTGSGRTVSDALQRVAADLNTFDLETGEEKTSLTGNILDLGFRVDFVNDPGVFPALEGQLGDDLATVQRRVGVGDDVEVTGTWRINRDGSPDRERRPVGLRTAFQNADQLVTTSLCRAAVQDGQGQKQEELSECIENGAKEQLSRLESERAAVRGTYEEERVRAAQASLWTDIAMAEANVSELLVSAGYRWRSEEVGPSSWKVNARYSYGAASVDTLKPRINALLDHGTYGRVARQNYWKMVESNPIPQHRIAVDLEYRRDERYEFDEFLEAPLALDSRTSFKVTAAYSLRFESGENRLYLPRFELGASWERSTDVDRTIDQGDRWVMSAIVIKPVPLFGSFVDLTVGVVWASRPEYVLDEDTDRMLGANLGLKLKLGGNGGTKEDGSE